MGTGGSLPADETLGGVKATTHLHLVLRLRCVELYIHYAIRLHNVPN